MCLGYRLPMTWPFLGAVGGATLAPQAQQAPLAAAAAAAVAQQQQQQLVLTPRSAQRRRYTEMKPSSAALLFLPSPPTYRLHTVHICFLLRIALLTIFLLRVLF